MKISKFFLCFTLCFLFSTNSYSQEKLNLVKQKLNSFFLTHDYEDDGGYGYAGGLSVTDVEEKGKYLIVSGNYKSKINDWWSDFTTDCRFNVKIKVILDDLEVTCCLIRTNKLKYSKNKCYYIMNKCDIDCPPRFNDAE